MSFEDENGSKYRLLYMHQEIMPEIPKEPLTYQELVKLDSDLRKKDADYAMMVLEKIKGPHKDLNDAYFNATMRKQLTVAMQPIMMDIPPEDENNISQAMYLPEDRKYKITYTGQARPVKKN